MLKQYNEFKSDDNITFEVGRTYFVDNKRMELSSIRNNRYIFIKGDDIVNVPQDKLGRYVSEKKNHIRKFIN